MTEILTPEQKAIVDYVRRPQGDLLIEATAGSGKTFALIKALEVIPQRSILVCAFNNKIARELEARAPKPRKGSVMHVKTFHAIGRTILLSHYPKLNFDRKGTEEIISKAIELRGEGGFAYPLRRAAVQLLRHFKETEVADGVGIADYTELIEFGRTHDLFDKLRDDQIDRVVAVVGEAYRLSMHPEQLTTVDFCDMIWMPIALGLTPPSRYQAIVVDEWQDMNEPQLELIRKLRAPGSGRLIMAGDGRQAINGWRGAVAQTVRSMMLVEHKAQVLTLTTSFRCSEAVIAAARQLVPTIKAAPGALIGSVSHCGLNDLPRMIPQAEHDATDSFILSRRNDALLDTALYLWREGVRFQLNAGQEMLAPLFNLLDVLDLSDKQTFQSSLAKWHAEQTMHADDLGSLELRERVDEQRSMLLSAINYVEPHGLRRLFNSILEPGRTGVMLSTVHKVKGLEARRVFLLRETFSRQRIEDDRQAEADAINASDERDLDGLPPQKPYELPPEEELNIEYVAITRAKEHLIWVDLKQRVIADAGYFKAFAKILKATPPEVLEAEYTKAEAEFQRYAMLGDEKLSDAWAKHMQLVQDELARRLA